MAITNSTQMKNAVTDFKCDQVDNGNLQLRDTETVVATFAMPAENTFASANDGVATANTGNIDPVNASADGTVDNYRVRNSSNEVLWEGTIGEAGSGADMIIQNTNVNEGQQLSITTWTHEGLEN